MKLLFDDSDQHIGGGSAPDLRLHRVLACAKEALDAQMLLDPFEEQFHLPATLVESRNGQGWQRRVVGQKHQRLARLQILEADTPQMFRVVLGHVVTIESDRLIAHHPRCAVGCRRIDAPGVHAAFGSGHKERAGLMHREESLEVQIAPVHHVDSEIKDSVIAVHRGVDALRACYHEMFTKNDGQHFVGAQGVRAYDHYKEKIGIETVNETNARIKKNKIIVEGVFAEGSLEALFGTFGKEWADGYLGRMANIHTIDAKYFDHAGEIFIFRDTVYLLSVKDLIIIEIRHSDIAVVITMLIKYIMDTTRTIDVNRRLRELMGEG